MDNQERTFEASMARLEEIVSLLEQGETPLDEALTLFEEGTKLAAACSQKLDRAEQSVMKLTAGADGTPEESPAEAAK